MARCVNSICNQTEQNIEIVLVDDGSQDKTYELCAKFAQRDHRVRVIHQDNGGLVNAWKKGVTEASGEYIIFCDSDDYLDLDTVEILQNKVSSIQVDIIAYGMKMEYEDGSIVYRDNRLGEGYYTEKSIIRCILPCYFSDGNMESGIIQASRCTKLFRREVLIKNMRYLSDEIMVGEDALTTFAAVLSAESIYCMKAFYPYHYMRNNESMIGKYDALLFQKMIALRVQMLKIADVYRYAYSIQIEAYFLSKVFLCMKKEICRNRNMGYLEIRKRLKGMRENTVMANAVNQCSIRKYDLKSRLFAYLVIRKQYLAVYVLTKMADRAGMGKE